MIKLWLDDIRTPPDESWEWVKTAPEAIRILGSMEVEIVSLDFDLGEGLGGYMESPGSGLEVARYIMTLPKESRPRIIGIHSQNPVGCKRMIDELRRED